MMQGIKILVLLSALMGLTVGLSLNPLGLFNSPEAEEATIRMKRALPGFPHAHEGHHGHHARDGDDHHNHHHDDPAAIHNKTEDFCVDLTHWTKPYDKNKTTECCKEKLEKKCTNHTEEVCVEDMPSLHCEIHAYKDCELTWVNKTLKDYSTEFVDAEYWRCEAGERNIEHYKKMPHCHNVTRHNCITKWVLDEESGQPTFKPTKDCKEVTWEECYLADKKVNFTVPYYNCTTEKYQTKICVETSHDKMVDKVICTPKAGYKCKYTSSKQCVELEYKHCEKVKVKHCEPLTSLHKHQDQIHQKICLQTEEVENPDLFTGILPEHEKQPVTRIQATVKMDCGTRQLLRIDELKSVLEKDEDNLDKFVGLTVGTQRSKCPFKKGANGEDSERSEHQEKTIWTSCEAAARHGHLEFGAATIADEDREKCKEALHLTKDRTKDDLPEVDILDCSVDYDTAITYISTGTLKCEKDPFTLTPEADRSG